jgi:opacity protein-like surface antigen
MKFTVKSIALSGVALAMIVSAAQAADPVVMSSDWTGFNVGIGGGGTFNFSNTNASGYGTFDVSGDESWMEGGYIFGSSGSSNYAFTSGSGTSGGNSQLWTAAAMGNAGSLIADIIDELGADSDAYDFGNGGDNDTGAAGFVGTVRGGFDYQLDRVVLGIDAAFNFGKTEIDNSVVGAAGGEIYIYDSGSSASSEGFGSSNLDTSLELGNSWSVGGRAGFLATDSTLLFGSAGYVSTNAKLSARFTGSNETEVDSNDTGFSGSASAGYDISASESDWLNGYYVGGGVEQLLTSNISLKLEYRFSDLGSIETSNSESLFDSSGDGSASWEAGVAAEAEPTVHSVMATINWRF